MSRAADSLTQEPKNTLMALFSCRSRRPAASKTPKNDAFSLLVVREEQDILIEVGQDAVSILRHGVRGSKIETFQVLGIEATLLLFLIGVCPAVPVDLHLTWMSSDLPAPPKAASLASVAAA